MSTRNTLKTLIEIPLKLRGEFPSKPILSCFRHGGWRVMTSVEFSRSVEDLSFKLLSMGIKRGDKCAIFSENCPEWLVADFAIMSCGALTVPLHSILPLDQVRFIVENSGIQGIFVSHEKLLRKILPLLDSCSGVKWIVHFKECASQDRRCTSWNKALQEGGELRGTLASELEIRRSRISADDISTIIYTSGTTGDPKGVMLSHGNFLSNIEAVGDLVEFDHRDVALSVLPLSHVLERLANYVLLSRGALTAFATSFETLQREFLEVQPTFCVVVPRILEVMRAKILSSIKSSSFPKRFVFSLGMKIGLKRGDTLLQGKRPSPFLRLLYAIFRTLVFKKLHRTLGGRFRFFISGGAALPPDLGRFFYAMGATICEGYGLTETSPVIAVNTPHDLRFGTVGRILRGVHIRISEDGEILVKGPNVMQGYYRNEKATEEAFQDGWFRTGDIGEIADGYLVITERKKNLIVTSSGKNIAPQRIENFLQSSPLISAAVVLGDSRSYISALIVPDFRKLMEEASRIGVKLEKGRRIIDDEKIKDIFRKEISSVTKPLASYEKIRKFALLGEEFTIEKGEVTATMKVRRDVIFREYRDVIESLYERESDHETGENERL